MDAAGAARFLWGIFEMITQKGNKIYRRQDKELLCIEPWGKNSFRVRATQRYEFVPEDISALLPPQECKVKVFEEDDCTVVENGKIRCEITPTGKLRFKNQDGKLLLEEFERIRADYRKEYNSALEIVPRTFEPHQNTDNFRLTVRFEPIDGEKLYGMGQYQQPYLDVKGCTLELAQRNSQASVPFVLSNNGYGFLWNNPAIGQVSFGKNVTEWTAVSTKQMDYWITAGDTPAEIEEAYADATGKVPMMPDYGTGFWQCKLRYMTQDEILEVAREYKRRKLPISVIVVDYFHWPNQGDWKFDTDFWPDPKAMVEELKEMGIELMVSIWPTVEETSENYKEMEELGYLTRSEHGKRLGQLNVASVIDVTNPDARKYVWEKIKKNYYSDGPKESQLMLLPDIITLTHKEMGIAKDNMELFEKAGFTLEEFGENTIKLTGVPNVCIDLETRELFLETLDEINTVARTAKQEIEERFIATVACKAAVKANMALTREEVDELMKELLVLPNPFTCPHGRPTAIRMSKSEIEKKFSRRL